MRAADATFKKGPTCQGMLDEGFQGRLCGEVSGVHLGVSPRRMMGWIKDKPFGLCSRQRHHFVRRPSAFSAVWAWSFLNLPAIGARLIFDRLNG
jgi:hypothetical protein